MTEERVAEKGGSGARIASGLEIRETPVGGFFTAALPRLKLNTGKEAGKQRQLGPAAKVLRLGKCRGAAPIGSLDPGTEAACV